MEDRVVGEHWDGPGGGDGEDVGGGDDWGDAYGEVRDLDAYFISFTASIRGVQEKALAGT